MELTTLSFRVETGQIENAVTQLDKLAVALKGVNAAGSSASGLDKLGKGASEAGSGLTQASEGAEKLNKPLKELPESISKVSKLIQHQSDILKFLRNDQKYAEDGFTKSQASLMATAQAAGASSAELQTLANVFKEISRVTGKNPFDQSASGLGQLKQQAAEMTNVAGYLAKGLNLTGDQVRLLTRDQIRLTEAMKQQGASEAEIAAGLDRLEKEYLQVAGSVNAYTAASRELERQNKLQNRQMAEQLTMMDSAVAQFRKLEEQKAEAASAAARKINDANRAAIDSAERLLQISKLMQGGMSQGEASKRVDLSNSGVELANIERLIAAEKDLANAKGLVSGASSKQSSAMSESAKASAWLEREIARAEHAVEKLNNQLEVSASNRLFKFKEMLTKAGITGEEAARQVDSYTSNLMAASAKSTEKSVDKVEKQLRNLSRAVSVQMGDVAVSLASGMNPFMIMIQQGDQLRGAFQQVDASAEQVRKSMTTAAGMIASSFIDTGKAIGGFFVGAFQAAMAQVNKFGAMVGGPFSKSLTDMRDKLELADAISGQSSWQLKALNMALAGVSAVAAGTAIAIGAFALAAVVAFVKVSRELDAMNKALILTGGSLGLIGDSALTFAKSFESIGVSTAKGVEILTAFAKEGKFTRAELEQLTPVVADMMKTFGMTAEEAVKSFSKFKKDPVDALYDLAIATGRVSLETLNMVNQMKSAGDIQGATTEAIKEAARVNAESVSMMEREYSTFGKTLNATKKFFGDLWDSIKGQVYSKTELEQLRENLAKAEAEARKAANSVKVFGITLWDTSDGHKAAANALKLQIALMEDKQKAEADSAANTVKAATAEKELHEISIKNLKDRAKLKNDLLKIDNLIRDAQTQEAKDKGYAEKARIQAEYDKKEAEKAKKLLDEELARLDKKGDALNALIGVSSSYNNEFTELMKLVKDGVITEDERIKRIDELLKKQPVYVTWLKRQAAQESELNKIRSKAEGFNSSYYDSLKKLDEIWLETGDLEAYAEQVNQLTKVQPNVKALEDANKSYESLIKSTRDYALSLQEQAGTLEIERETLGLNGDERDRRIGQLKVEIKYQKELAAIMAAIKSGKLTDPEKITELLTAASDNRAKGFNIVDEEASLKSMKKVFDDAENFKNGVADAIVTGLFEGGKAGRKKLRDLIVAELRKPITVFVKAVVDNLVGSTLNSFLGSAGSTAAGTSGSGVIGSALGSMAGGATLNSMGSYFATGAMNTVAGTGMSAGMTAGSAVGGANGIAMQLGAAAPYIAAALALYAIYKKLDDSGTPHTGASASYSAGAGSKTGMGLYGVGSNQGHYSTDVETTMAAMSKGIVDLLDQTALSFGKTAGYEAAVAFADDSSKDGAWGSLAISKLGQELAGFGKDGNGRWPGKSFSDGEAGIKEFNNAVAADVRSALESIGLPEWASKMLKDIGDAPSMEKLGEVIGKINATQKAIESLGRVMPMFANLTSESMSSLLSAFGSVENLSSTAAGYYSNFFDDNEKAKAATEALSNEFKKLNVAVPTDRLAYRVEVEKALAEGNEELAAKLMMLSGAFAELNPWAESTGRTAQDIAANLAEMKKEGTELSIQLMTLQGKTAEANAAARLLAIEGLSELEIAAYDSNQVIRAQIAELTTKQDLDKQILELEGKKDILKQMELDKLSPANQELQKYIWSLQKAATAAEEAAAANDALVAQRTKLSDQLFQLQASEYDKQQKILADLKDSQSAAIQQQIWDVEAKQKKEAEAADKKKQLEQSAYDLETQKLQLLGDTKTLRERELALLDPSLKAAKLEIWAIQDKIEADKIAAQAAEEAARAQQQAAEEAARAAQQIKDAWKSITDSIFEEVARIRGLVTGSGSNSLAQAQANFDSASSRALAGDQEAAKSLPELSRVLLEVAGEQARSLVDLRRIQMLTAANLESVGTRINGMYGIPIPAYADGGNYAGGIALVGEQGPELINFNSGGRVYDAKTSAAMMGNSNLEALVEKLNANIEGLRYEVRANVTHTSKVAKILERVSPEGDAIVVKFDTAQPVNVV